MPLLSKKTQVKKGKFKRVFWTTNACRFFYQFFIDANKRSFASIEFSKKKKKNERMPFLFGLYSAYQIGANLMFKKKKFKFFYVPRSWRTLNTEADPAYCKVEQLSYFKNFRNSFQKSDFEFLIYREKINALF